MTTRIQLDKPDMTFSPGEKITGSVIASLGKVCKYESISVTFTGEGEVSWTESTDLLLRDFPRNPPTQPRPRPHTSRRPATAAHPTHHSSTPQLSNPKTIEIFKSKESYLNHKIFLVGKEGSGDILELPEGISQFTFSYTLPAQLPLSLETLDGHVRYKIIAKVKRTWYKLDIQSTTNFKVSGHLDLNHELGVGDPVTLSQGRLFDNSSCYCAWLLSFAFPVNLTQGEIRFSLTVPRTGFVPGDFIPFTAVMWNLSLTDVPSSTISLVQTLKYFADGAKKSVSTVLSTSSGPGVTPGESSSWAADTVLKVPSPCLLSRLGACHIIHVTYKLKFEMEIGGIFTQNLSAEQQLVIGSVDFLST